MRRILIIGSQNSIHTIRWVNALVERGYLVTVLTMHDFLELFHENVEVIKLPFKNPYGYLLNIPFVKKIVKSYKPDIIHSFYAFGYGFLGRSTGYSPHIISVLGSDIYSDPEKNFLFKRIIKKNILSSDVICSTSNIMAEKIKEVTGQDREIKITPFGVDIMKFTKIPNLKDLDFELTLGTVKKMEDKYGIDILIKSFALFVRKHPDLKVRLIIVGEGSKREELISLSKELNVFEKCEFVGPVKHDDVHNWLNKFDIFLALSRSESFGVSVIEAMACELPVIVSNIGGLKEVVTNDETGLIVSNEDPVEVSKKLEYLYQNPKQAIELGKNARAKVILRYSWKKSVEIMNNIYKSI
ncbi:glycosyltransferase family 4 protein [bacterium]|nr:glycosyltransferase family 4 protein [bacterium]